MEADILAPDHYLKHTPGRSGRLLGDERLAQAVASGNERAFTTLFQRYHQQLYRYCRGLTGNEQDAQDALQTAFTKALVALRVGRRTTPVRPWLYRIAHNESISVIRRRDMTLVELPLDLEAAHAVAESAEQRERLAMLVADLRELPEQQRGALVMRELSGLSHEEIAVVLQVSVGAAKQSILEARRSLLEFAEGRAMRCEEIQRVVSDEDRRSLRSRRVRAHLRDCGACATFAQAIPRRRAEMLALWPMLPAASSAGLLAKITGAGSGHGGGGAGLASGTAAKGVGATISIKAAAAASVAVVATATVGAVAVLHQSAPATRGSASRGRSLAPAASGSDQRLIAARSRSGASARGTANHTAVVGGKRRRAGTVSLGHTSGASEPSSSGQSQGSSNSSGSVTGPAQSVGQGNAATKVTGNTVAKTVNAAHHGPSHTAHGKPVKVNPSVVHKSSNPNVGHGKTKPNPPKGAGNNNGNGKAKGSGKGATAGTGESQAGAATTPAAETKTTGNGKTVTTGNGKTASTQAPTTTVTDVSTTASTTAASTDTSSSPTDVDNGLGNGGVPASRSAGSPANKNAK